MSRARLPALLLLALLMPAGRARAGEPEDPCDDPKAGCAPAPVPVAVPVPVIDKQPDRPPDPARLDLRLKAGWGFRSLEGVSIDGAEMRVGLGVAWRHLMLEPQVALLVGDTGYGLGTRQVRGGPVIGAIFDRVRFGGGLHVGWLSIDRISQPGATMDDVTFGVWSFVAVDVLRGEHRALFVEAEASAEMLTTNGQWMPGAGLAIGFRD